MDPLTITVVSIEELDTLVNALIPLINDWKMGKPVSLDDMRAAAANLAGDITTLDQTISHMPDDAA